jgi:hypothetical protein
VGYLQKAAILATSKKSPVNAFAEIDGVFGFLFKFLDSIACLGAD